MKEKNPNENHFIIFFMLQTSCWISQIHANGKSISTVLQSCAFIVVLHCLLVVIFKIF